MFDLEKSMAEWREQMLAAGIRAPEPLGELEGHLREEINNLTAAGRPEAEAFHAAVAGVGNPGKVVAEFKKAKLHSSLPVMIGSLVWAGSAAALLAALLGQWAEGKRSLLLTAHIFSLTTGYFSVFLAGGLGIYWAGRNRYGILSTDQEERLNSAVRRFTQVSAGLVALGLLCGMAWSAHTLGRYLTGDPREMGAWWVAGWLAMLALIQRFTAMNIPNTMRLGIASSMITGLGWFGAGALSHGENIISYWPLDALLGVHLFFLAVSLMPRPNQLKHEVNNV